jgi:hypothetical protein
MLTGERRHCKYDFCLCTRVSPRIPCLIQHLVLIEAIESKMVWAKHVCRLASVAKKDLCGLFAICTANIFNETHGVALVFPEF